MVDKNTIKKKNRNTTQLYKAYPHNQVRYEIESAISGGRSLADLTNNREASEMLVELENNILE